MTYPITAPASVPLSTALTGSSSWSYTNQNPANGIGNYSWGAADSGPINVRAATTGAETYTIVSGSVTVINGTTIDVVSVAVNDPILIKDAPIASGAGSLNSAQAANGVYYVTGLVGGNMQVARCATMSAASSQPNPAGRVAIVRAGGAVNASSLFMVTTPSGVGTFTWGTTAMQWTKYLLTPAVAVPNARRPLRNTIAAVGDSITALGSYGWYQPWLGHTWINQLQVLSHQRIRYGGGNFSVAGTAIATQQSVQLPLVLAMNPLPGACVLAVGTNDIQSTGYSFSTTATALKQMVAALLAVGVVPILWCPPPNNYVGSVSVATVHARTYAWNTWIRRYAAANGFALVDAFTALAKSDGTMVSGATTDLIHPTGYGHRLIAQQALADGLADIFPPNSLVNTARTTDDLTNLFNSGTVNYGLFTTDANSDGVADGLTGSGTGTYSFTRVAPVSTDQLLGFWQQATVSAGGTANLIASFSTGWSVGDTIAFSARIQTSGVDASNGSWHLVALKTDTPGGFSLPDGSGSATYLWNGTYVWDGDIDDGDLYIEFVIPATATDLIFNATLNAASGGTATLRVGEVTVRNLTTGGLLI